MSDRVYIQHCRPTLQLRLYGCLCEFIKHVLTVFICEILLWNCRLMYKPYLKRIASVVVASSLSVSSRYVLSRRCDKLFILKEHYVNWKRRYVDRNGSSKHSSTEPMPVNMDNITRWTFDLLMTSGTSYGHMDWCDVFALHLAFGLLDPTTMYAVVCNCFSISSRELLANHSSSWLSACNQFAGTRTAVGKEARMLSVASRCHGTCAVLAARLAAACGRQTLPFNFQKNAGSW